MLKIIKDDNIWKLAFLSLLLIISKKIIICDNITCFEYSCEECNSPEYGNCTKCRYSWTLIDGTCPCFNSSCILCTTGFAGSNVCKLCKKGYRWDNYECYCNISNCEQCGENTCLKCKYGYIYNSTFGECEKVNNESLVSCYDKHCDNCISGLKGTCTHCEKNYIKIKGECFYKYQVYEHYYVTLFPYYYSTNCNGGDCSIRYNDDHNDYYCLSNKCLICYGGSELKIIDECDNSVECSSIDGCLNCISNEDCVYCDRGYYLLGGLCYKCIEGCSICSNNETCEYCLSGFELTLDRKCNLTYNFDFDIDLYNKYKEELIDQKCSDNKCLKCSFKNGSEICEKCISGYIGNSSICTRCSDPNCLDCFYFKREYCTKCIDRYKIYSYGNCELICSDENCYSCYLDNGKEYCEGCFWPLKINNEKCSSCSDHCGWCYFEDGKEMCKYCRGKGYILKNGICEMCSVGNYRDCYLYYGEEICTECGEGYFLKDNICGKCSNNNCWYCNLSKYGEEYCSECNKGYIIENGNCIRCSDENWRDCYLNGGKEYCIDCGLNYKPKNGRCLKCLNDNCENCYFKDSKEICIECELGYELIEGNCSLIKCDDKNCKKCYFDKNNKCICIECKTVAELRNGSCVFQEDFCFYYFQIMICNKCLGSGICVECTDRYEFDNSGNCKFKKKIKIMIVLIILASVFIILIIIFVIKTYKKYSTNEVRINQNIRVNRNNSYIRNQNIQKNKDILFLNYENALINEFNKQKIIFEKNNKLCYVCKKKSGKYIGDCGCILCEVHSNLKLVKKGRENNKICFNCGKVNNNLVLLKNNCHICFQEGISVCHFKCGCALEVCENCYIKCKKLKKECPGCRGRI